jgi:chaperonin GroEL
MLEDIAVLTGGMAVTEDLGVKLESMKIEDLGEAKKVTIDRDTTTLVDGGGTSASIAGRVNQLRKQIEDTTSEYDRDRLQERLAKLVGGVAIISRCSDRDRVEEEESSRRGRDARHESRRGRRHRARWRCGAAARSEGARAPCG